MGSATSASSENRHDQLAVTSIRIERQKLDALKRVAAANRRSVSQELQWLIDRHLEAEADAA